MRRTTVVFAITLCLLSLSFPSRIYCQSDNNVKDGLRRVETNYKGQKIIVFVPADIRQGETVSGTVIREEKKEQGRKLQGVVLEVNDQPIEKSGSFSFTTSDEIPFTLNVRDNKGKLVDQHVLPLSSRQRTRQTNTLFPDFVVRNPSGSTIVRAAFPADGIASTTLAKVNQKPAEILAESGGEIFINTPPSAQGKTTISVTENGRTYTDDVQLIKLDVQIAKNQLLKNETSKGMARVSGLAGYEKPLFLSIQNMEPAKVNVSGGNDQVIPIETSSGSDSWQHAFEVQALQSGSFSIWVNVIGGKAGSSDDKTKDDPTTYTDPVDEHILQYIDSNDPEMLSHINMFYAFTDGQFFDVETQDFHLPRKYRFDPDRVTRPAYGAADVRRQQKQAQAESKEYVERVEAKIVSEDKELKDVIWPGQGKSIENRDRNCYDMVSGWVSGKKEVYYENRYQTSRELVDILRFNNIRANAQGELELQGTVSSDWSMSASFGVEIPNVGSVGISVTPPSSSKLSAKGRLSAQISGYLNGKTMVIYVYKDTHREETGEHLYYWRYIQRYCDNEPDGPVRKDLYVEDIWSQKVVISYFADTYLVTEGIPDGEGDIHVRRKLISSDKLVDRHYENYREMKPTATSNAADFFDDVSQ